MRFLSNFGCKIIFMCCNNFCIQQDSNLLFKGTIGHVTSLCNWPIAINFHPRTTKRCYQLLTTVNDICNHQFFISLSKFIFSFDKDVMYSRTL